jgi:hypothetical protein
MILIKKKDTAPSDIKILDWQKPWFMVHCIKSSHLLATINIQQTKTGRKLPDQHSKNHQQEQKR